MKRILGMAGVLAAALVMAPARAETLYKCIGSDGVPNFVSKRIHGASCSVVASYRPAPRRAVPPPVTAPAPVTPPAVVQAVVPATAAVAAPVAAAIPKPVPAAPMGQRLVSGQLYSYMQDGVRHYTSTRPAAVASIGPVRTIRYSFMERCYACGPRPGVDFGTIRLNTQAYSAEITAAAREFGVEEAVVRAVIHAESAFDPTSLSRTGAQGLMQLMPETAQRFGVANPWEPSQNIRGGTQYLAWLLHRYNGNLTLAAAGYNAGEGAVDRYGGVPPYSETQYYVQRVAQLADRYRGESGASK